MMAECVKLEIKVDGQIHELVPLDDCVECSLFNLCVKEDSPICLAWNAYMGFKLKEDEQRDSE